MSPNPPLQGEPERSANQPVTTLESANSTAPAESEKSRTLGIVALVFSSIAITIVALLILPVSRHYGHDIGFLLLGVGQLLFLAFPLALIGLVLGIVAAAIDRGRGLGYLAIVLGLCPFFALFLLNLLIP